MRYISINENDFNNGDGVVVSLWTAGCPHNCKGCHNKETHDKDQGTEFDENKLLKIIGMLKDPFISGLSILGGEPLADYNFEGVSRLVEVIKLGMPSKKIWLWTGYTLEELIMQGKGDILTYVDVLIDGRYVEELKDPNLKYRGSSNQKVRRKVTSVVKEYGEAIKL